MQVTNAQLVAQAYAQIMRGASDARDTSADGITAQTQPSGAGFGDMLTKAVSGAIDAGHRAELGAAQGLTGGGDMTQIVSAVSDAQLALQTTTVIRDRMIQSYQDVMRMAI